MTREPTDKGAEGGYNLLGCGLVALSVVVSATLCVVFAIVVLALLGWSPH